MAFSMDRQALRSAWQAAHACASHVASIVAKNCRIASTEDFNAGWQTLSNIHILTLLLVPQ